MDKEKVKVKKNKLDSTKSVKNSIDKGKIVELYFSKRLKEKSSVSAFKRLSSK